MKNIFTLMMVVAGGLLLSGCSVKKEIVTKAEKSIESVPTEVTEIPTDITYTFLVKLTEDTKIPFLAPVKADIFWTEGETVSTRKTFFGDSYLISYSSPSPEDEKTVENYFKENNFTYMKFNESKGDDSHKVGYRRDNLVCKYDWDKYPDEDAPHLIVYCTDSDKGTERK
ncbi:MAG TPA: hypothetical protein PK257_03620 [Candidatus Woesebacteria bacterium]|nr:hypothetical protein [Candidatus Woesebacteria bacterium]